MVTPPFHPVFEWNCEEVSVDFITGFKHKTVLAIESAKWHFTIISAPISCLKKRTALMVGFLAYSITTTSAMEDHSNEK